MKLESFVPKPIGTKLGNPCSTSRSYNFLKHQEEKKKLHQNLSFTLHL